MEEAVGTGGDGLVAIDAAWANHTDRSRQLSMLVVHVLHHTSLNARGVRAEQDVLGDIVGMLADEEGVLHITGRMVSGKVHLREHVEIVFYLRTVCQNKAHTREDIDDLVGDDGERMACAELDGVGCARQVDGLVASLLCLALLAQQIDALCSHCLQFVDLHADSFLLVGSHIAEVVHQGRNLTFFTEIFETELFNFLCVFRT